MKTKAVKIRNIVASAPIMRKGGVHGKSNKARRRDEKMALRRSLEAYPKAA